MNVGKCNCGRAARYITGADWAESSCNKHKACPPYSQIETELAQHRNDLQELIGIADDLRFFMEGTDYHNDAEYRLDQYKKKYSL